MNFSRRFFYVCTALVTLLATSFALVQLSNAEVFANQANLTPLVRGVIVQLKPSTSHRSANELERPTSERLKTLGVGTDIDMDGARYLGNGHHALAFSKRLDARGVQRNLAHLRAHPDVLFAEPDELLYRKAVPNDTDYASKQWYLQSSVANAGATNTITAWNTVTGSSSVVVAVLDTGIRPHADLSGRYLAGYDFVTNDVMGGVSFSGDGDGRDADPSDPGDWITLAESNAISPTGVALCDVVDSSWHGTFIAGIIGAATNNGAGIAGINWTSKILPVRVAGKCGAYSSNIIDGMRWAAGLTVSGVPNNSNPAKVINLSFGGSGACSAAYQSAINEVTAAGSLVVVAAGNESGVVGKPANCANAMAVGAARHDGLKVNYSNYGAEIALLAPGGGLTTDVAYPSTPLWSLSNAGTTAPASDNYADKAGTSFSAPLVAGVASLMLSVNPALKPAALIGRMKASVRPHTSLASLVDVRTNTAQPIHTCGAVVSNAVISGTCNCTTSTCGAGLLDAGAALAAALSPAANIATIASPAVSSLVSLDGRASGAVGASVNTYLWTQTSGSAISIPSPTSAQTTIQLPSTAGTFTFKLQVADSLGRTGTDEMTFTSVAPAIVATPAASGGGAVSLGWGLGLLCLLVVSLIGAVRRNSTLARG